MATSESNVGAIAPAENVGAIAPANWLRDGCADSALEPLAWAVGDVGVVPRLSDPAGWLRDVRASKGARADSEGRSSWDDVDLCA